MIGVGAVVVKDGKILLIQRGQPPRQGSWSFPGGLQHVGETVEAAALRELAEETHISADILETLDVVDLIERDQENRVRYHFTIIDMLAKWREGEARPGSDAAQVVWADWNALEPYALTEAMLRMVAKARKRIARYTAS